MDTVEHIWQDVLGAPYPLAEVPSPADPDSAADTSSISIPHPKLTALIGAMEEVATRLEHAAHEASEGKNGAYEFYDDLEKELGTLAQDVRDAIKEVI